MSENRRSEGTLVTLQYCTAMSNIPAGTPLGILTDSNQIYTLGSTTTGFSNTANIGGAFIGIADADISALQTTPVNVWIAGVFELTAASAWTTAYVGAAVMGDSGKVCTIGAILSGQAPIGSYIPAGTLERSGGTILVKINPVMWRWSTLNVISSLTSGINGSAYPRML